MKALVFSGGGARGAYQVGVWKALDELNIKCDIVVGTSIGSANAALYSENKLDTALKLWNNLSINSVFKEDKLSLRMEPTNFKNILSDAIDPKLVLKSNIKYGLVTCSYPKFQKKELTYKDLSNDNLIDYILASCTVFPVFKTQKINNKKYIDGGFKEPIPINLAKKMGATELIIVNISALKPNYKPKDKNVTYIKPKRRLVSPLKFDKENAKRNILLGYNDTLKVYGKYYGNYYTFKENYKDIKTLEYIGKYFKIDDTKIYSLKEFNNIIIKNNYNIVKYGKERSLSYKAYKYIEELKRVF